MKSTYPGVYTEEIHGGARPVEGVPTSIAAFIGRARRGPVDTPVRIQNFRQYEQRFGGLWADSTMSHSVAHFFRNGGSDAIVVRVDYGGLAGSFTFSGDAGDLVLEAANPGSWANNLDVKIDHRTQDPEDDVSFNLVIREVVDGTPVTDEVFREVSIRQGDDRCVERVLRQGSDFLRAHGRLPARRPNPGPPTAMASGSDGDDIGYAQVADPWLNKSRRGLWALGDTDIFNLLCIPPFAISTDVDARTWAAAQEYCEERLAILIIDPPSTWNSPSDVVAGNDLAGAVPARHRNAAVYFPRLKMPNPLAGGRVEAFPPSGAIAGIYARTDAQRGVWKAPAGIEAGLAGAADPEYTVTEAENEELNRSGVNCLRNFPGRGTVVWGARTTVGADHLASDWKYVSVRRLALYVRQSLYRGTEWIVLEPNDETLWATIRRTADAFMHDLFRAGHSAAASLTRPISSNAVDRQ